MPHNDEITWADAVKKIEAPCRILLRELPAAEEVRLDLIAAQDSATDLAWGRILFETGDTRTSTLTVTASTKVINCLTGANLFSGFRVGRNVQLSAFTNAGNNQTTEITAVDSDSITVGDATGLVDETDTAARAQENPDSIELDKIDDLQATMVGIEDLNKALNNTTITASDIIGLLRDFS